nr:MULTISPECIES: hypothetical protein [unclassified Corynebacterium]
MPQEIYVRRRVAAAVLVLVAVIALIWAAVALGGGEEEDQSPVSTATSSPQATAEPSADKTREATEPPRETQEPSAAPSTEAAAKRTCELSDLQITASTSQATYRQGDKPAFYMTVKNPTAADCEIDLDRETLRFEVYSMVDNARVWADVDCNPSEGSGRRSFPAGEERHFESVWSRTTSAPKQCESRAPVEPGAYYLHAVIGRHASPAQPFNLA